MPFDKHIIYHRNSLLAPDPLKKKDLYTDIHRPKMTMDPKAMFLCNPPLVKSDTPPPSPSISNFTSIWRIDNPGDTIYLPIYDGGNYDFFIDWGDGNTDTVTSYLNNSHTYSTAGDYTVIITGTIEGWSFDINYTSSPNLIEILKWGQLLLGNNGLYFGNCYRLTLANVTDVPSLQGTTSLGGMFADSGVTTINNIEFWDFSNITSMSSMFSNCPFDGNIGNWNVSNVQDMSFMFSNNRAFNNGGSPSINDWNTSSVTNMLFMFTDAISFNQPIGNWDVSNVTDMESMFNNSQAFNQDLSGWCVSQFPSIPTQFDYLAISWTGGTATRPQWGFPCSAPFRSIWNVSGGETIYLPLISIGTYNFVVYWGDGNFETITDYTTNTHTYTDPGEYIISIYGTIDGWSFGSVSNSKLNIIEILSWGPLKLGNDAFYFNDCQNLTLTGVTDVLNLEGTTNLNGMFILCLSLTTVNNMNSWDTSNVTTMNNIFNSCVSFNQPIGNWDVSNVTDMTGIFNNAQSFNQPIGNWNVSNATNMDGTFLNASSFNQDIGNWDVSNVNIMSSMFNGATSFNQNIGTWNVSGVSDMNYMFSNATSFNQDIGTWNVSNVQYMGGLFIFATSFNQDIGNWDVSGVTVMSYMLYNATSFNQDLSNWCVTQIPSPPSNFDTDATSWLLPRPNWGTCP